MKWAGKVLGRVRRLLPIAGYSFSRPIVMFQSDDWGRVGLRDIEALERLREAGLQLGDRPYDFYSLETADDLETLSTSFRTHRDSVGRHPCLEMNFILGNLDFGKMESEGWKKIHIRPLAEGLPAGWARPGLTEAYLDGIAHGIFHPALHGMTHFCRQQVESNLESGGERANLLRMLWQAGTPYIHWRMPWIGYEYWNPEEKPDDRFLPETLQRELIGEAVGAFAKMFTSLPKSACAPGYRANEETVQAWAEHGIKVAQNGPGALIPPHFDRNEILQLTRTIEFEPATNQNFSVEDCVRRAEISFSHGLPVIVSVHSINFHSSVRDFLHGTIRYLNEFLTAIESEHNDLLYLHDADLWDLVQTGTCPAPQGSVQVSVRKKPFTMANATGKKVV